MFRMVKQTSPGIDGIPPWHDHNIDSIPPWLDHNSPVELADLVAQTFNAPIRSGTVLSNWRLSIITQITQITKGTTPLSVDNFRPISVTPILLHMAEKLIVY